MTKETLKLVTNRVPEMPVRLALSGANLRTLLAFAIMISPVKGETQSMGEVGVEVKRL